jgi:hypothetical protein
LQNCCWLAHDDIQQIFNNFCTSSSSGQESRLCEPSSK